MYLGLEYPLTNGLNEVVTFELQVVRGRAVKARARYAVDVLICIVKISYVEIKVYFILNVTTD